MSAEAEKMTAAVYRDGTIEVKQIPRPQPGENELVIKVEAAAICATDLKIWKRGHRNIASGSETVLGHEVVGKVSEVGSKIDKTWLGKRVVIPPNVGCGACPACEVGWDSYCPDYKAYGVGLPGSFAEYMLVGAPPASTGKLISVADHIPTKVAVLAEAASCCYRGLLDCELQPEEKVLVLGAGPMGILSIIAAKAMGASTIISADLLEERRNTSKKFGAGYTLNPAVDHFVEAVKEASGGWGVDVVMVTAPFAGAQRQGIMAAAVGGRINLFAGLSLDDRFDDFPSNLVHYRGLKVLGSTGATSQVMQTVVNLMAEGHLALLQQAVTAFFPLEDMAKALEMAGSGREIKVMVVPDSKMIV